MLFLKVLDFPPPMADDEAGDDADGELERLDLGSGDGRSGIEGPPQADGGWGPSVPRPRPVLLAGRPHGLQHVDVAVADAARRDDEDVEGEPHEVHLALPRGRVPRLTHSYRMRPVSVMPFSF
ncbi:hypothetical protein CEXT_431271 [Caerostris extrusa]|uniref:Uncharacterized protein n=1 Tax=Caerostris extrusa TaxID=172846 RepID=A0AAV4XH03_CAEEX|nr:hypothetical protein CEXT_431271 [Caerostris extrusa]